MKNKKKREKKTFLGAVILTVAMGILIVVLVIMLDPFSGDVFKEKEKEEILEEDLFIVDQRDGERYKTVKIGEQHWFAENLKISKESLGELLLKETKEEWRIAGEEEVPAYAAYNNDDSNRDVYGYLYNWHAVESLDLCPEGWTVPTDEDWHKLEVYLADTGKDCRPQRSGSLECDFAGIKMKTEDSLEGDTWNSEEFNCQRNSRHECSGFNALPGGSRYTSGSFFRLGSQSYFWSSSYEDDKAFYRNLRENSSGVLRNESSFGLGMSVRCVESK